MPCYFISTINSLSLIYTDIQFYMLQEIIKITVLGQCSFHYKAGIFLTLRSENEIYEEKNV